jgi:formate hydrogenlyase subunit 6/NADH:ubiquinone oxidoreductase subunit I
MFNILQIIEKNLADGPVTISLPHKEPPPTGFRGLVLLDPELCVGCGLCAYVCVSESVTGASSETEYQWHYEPGRCTFCARCVDRCPASALHMSAEAPPVYSSPGALDTSHTVPFPACKRCGKPKRPTSESLLHSAAGQIDDQTRELYDLCERCRRLHYQTSMKSMLSGSLAEERR